MSLSSFFLAPVYDRLVAASERACMAEWRANLLADLGGQVLEVGAGTGANLPHYRRESIERLVLAEPDPNMRRQLHRRLATVARPPADVVDASAYDLPRPPHGWDAIVSTLVLCSVADPARALAEYRRVLRPGGALIFIEHVAAHDRPDRLRWQRRAEPVWKRVFGNCHLTRDTATAIERAGFAFEHIRRESARKAFPLVRPTIRGVAR